MDGMYQVGDNLKCVCAPVQSEDDTGIIAQVGLNGVTEIVVDKAAGPMGWYAVANVFKGDNLSAVISLHFAAWVEIA
jgi:hypothetical protein